MSIYTQHEKIKSLWHPITDEDFNIDFSIPLVLFTEEGSLLGFDPNRDEMGDYWDDMVLFEEDGKTMTEESRNYFRRRYYGYMYVDDEFYYTTERVKHERLENVKAKADQANIFIKYKNGHFRFLDIYDFRQDGSPYRDWNTSDVAYFVNLDSVPATSLNGLFLQLD